MTEPDKINGAEPETWPLITGTTPGIGGRVKTRPEDFEVEERPLYELEGDGPHLYFSVTKQGIPTDSAVDAIADHMNVNSREIGYAGRKDARAVTTQRMSLEHADEDRLEAFDHDRIDLEILGWHRNKLQPGHLAGNEFTVTIRETEIDGDRIDDILDTLRTMGVPNYFGPQRFGRRGDTALLGKLMVTDQLEEFVDAYFGRPKQADPDPIRRARRAYDSGEYKRAIDRWPDSEHIKRRALSTYIDRQAPKPVLSAIPTSRRQLFVSAFQSQLFNEQVGRRIDSLDRVFDGGIAKKTDTGGMFRVEDEETEQPRASRFEISPTGSLPGTDLWEAGGLQGRLEQNILDEHCLSLEAFDKVSYLGATGSRRPLRFKSDNLTWSDGSDSRGQFVEVSFFAPSGCYATVLLKEIMEPR